MKILITYSSKTGNTKKVATEISKQILKADFLPINEVNNLDYDLFIIGGWIDKATFDSSTTKFINKLSNKKIAYFYTLGAYPDSDHSKECVKNIDKIFEINNNEIVARFFCQGAIDPKLISWMSKLPSEHIMAPTEERIKKWEIAKNHPDATDLKNATDFAKSILASLNI